MRKITDFIVEKRYIVLVIVIMLTVWAVFLENKVNINYDMAKYLPKTSDTRIGMDIMESEFDSNSSTLNVMLQDLGEEEKKEALDYLENMTGVSVEYDSSDNYNKDNYTLFVLTVDDDVKSNLARDVYNEVVEHFKDNLVDTSGDVTNTNKDVLPFYVVAIAVLSALVILIIMCESYIEPFLFLITILIAVFLNKGTNIMFSSVSNITSSICAILQMALSMDYSIMLIARYRQEREETSDKVIAMKRALHHAFLAISSSSVTTVVGLLALVFMSFTIGKDLGFVLAKGVILSLFCIFTCLPALILMSDKLIYKTKKKSPIIKLDFLGKLAYKFRYVILVLFIGIFGVSYLLKGNLGILYTQSGTDEIEKVFKLNNQMAIIYPNREEKEIAEYCKTLEKNKKFDEVLCNGNTINEEYTYNTLNKRLNDLGANVAIDDYLLKIVYYHYYNKAEDNKIKLNDLLTFIQNDVYSNDKMSENIDDEMRKNILKLEVFSSKEELNKKRSKNDIARILDIDNKGINDLFTLYEAKYGEEKVTMTEFLSFINNTVLKDEEYQDRFSKEMQEKLKILYSFTNKDVINKEINYQEMANILNISLDDSFKLYIYYLSKTDISDKLTINDFSNFIINDVIPSKAYGSMISNDARDNITTLKTFSDKKIILREINYQEMAKLLNMNEEDIKKIYLGIFGSRDNDIKISGKDIKVIMPSIASSYPEYFKDIDMNTLNLLSMLDDNKEYTVQDFVTSSGLPKEKVSYLFVLMDIENLKISPYEFILEMLSNKTILSNMDESTIESTIALLNKLKIVMESTINDVKYGYTDMASILGLSKDDVKMLYSLYGASLAKISPYELVDKIVTNKDDKELKDALSMDEINNFSLLKKIMDSILKGNIYTRETIADALGINKSDIDLIMGLYENKKYNIELSMNDFIRFLVKDVINNEEYNKSFDNDKKLKIKTLDNIISNTLNDKSYNKDELYNTLKVLSGSLDKDLIDLVYIYYGSVKDYRDNYTLTINNFIRYLNEDIIKDKRFDDYIDEEMREDIIAGKDTVGDAKELLVGKNYGRVVLNTKLEAEDEETFKLITEIKKDLSKRVDEFYLIGDSPMAKQMSESFQGELNLITVLTMIFIFVVVAFTFKSLLIPIVLVLLIQAAVFVTMGILSFGGDVYFISILIVQSILMGATIDYAILYTSYYIEERKKMNIKEAIISAYNNSIHTIITSGAILIIVTLIVGKFASAIAAKICLTISEGTMRSCFLILLLLPGMLAAIDKFIIKNK